MVVGAFPVAKLATLLIRQVSKPIANAIKDRAKDHPVFRVYVCMPPAQFYNWCEIKTKMWILNLGKPVNIPVLSQEMAIELGANLLGEGIIFTIAATLLIMEYNRQANKEAAKEAKKEEEMKTIYNKISELFFTIEQQQAKIREMERIISALNMPIAAETNPPPKKSSVSSNTPDNGSGPQKDKSKIEPDKCSYEHQTTPYPNNGLILKTLNYIQMDLVTTPVENSSKLKHPKISHKRTNKEYERKPALITGILESIQHDMKGLF